MRSAMVLVSDCSPKLATARIMITAMYSSGMMMNWSACLSRNTRLIAGLMSPAISPAMAADTTMQAMPTASSPQ